MNEYDDMVLTVEMNLLNFLNKYIDLENMEPMKFGQLITEEIPKYSKVILDISKKYYLQQSKTLDRIADQIYKRIE